MTLVEQSGEKTASPRPAFQLPRLRWTQILAISIFWLGLNFHWAALGIIILPSQVFKIVGDLNKGQALAFVLVPGAFVALFANPLFGMLSDRTRGRLAAWGRRRPYILFGALVNVVGLFWMAASRDIVSLAAAYVLVQFSSNAATAPFHALLPDVVPSEQRGLASGVMGLFAIVGSVGGASVASFFIDANQPLPAYALGLWLAYGSIIAVLLALMLITITSVRERKSISFSAADQQEALAKHPLPIPAENIPSARRSWLSRSVLSTVFWTFIAAGIAWSLMALWNTLASVQIGGGVQQLVLIVIATIGILRLFDFKPRRDPDFAWVLLTRLMMTLGIYSVQDFLQFFMRDIVKVPHPEQQTTNFLIIVSLASLSSAIGAGWLSDRVGRKRMVYISGGFLVLVGVTLMIIQSLPLVLASGAILGIGYGAYTSVDWALVADVLPSDKHYARDMGVWNISLSLPQVIAPVIGGLLIDHFTATGAPLLGFQFLSAFSITCCLLGTVTVYFIRGVKN